MCEEKVFVAGMRVKIRDAEWFVKKTEPVDAGGTALFVRGITPPVQGRDQVFWSEAEDEGIEIIRPEDAQFRLDTSPHAADTRLRVESAIRSCPAESGKIAVAHRAAMDVMNYQLEPAMQALNSPRDPRSRILIADAVGLGKTLEAGILLSELAARGRAKRILVVTLKSTMAQFQKEMWERFAIALVRLDSAGLQRIRQEIPSHHNPFNFYDRAIVSIDTLKQDNQFRAALESARWDAVVIDEAHNVAAKKSGYSRRYRLAAKLADRCDHLILLSATPHDGTRESFASLMAFLDPLAIPDPSNYTADDIGNLFIRRFKSHVAGEIAKNFPERRLESLESGNSEAEAALCRALEETELEMDGTKTGAEKMFRTTLMKALLSSPAAFISTAKNRRDKLKKDNPGSGDIAKLEILLELAEEIKTADFTKFNRLVEDLNKTSGWDPKNPRDRVVVFTESIPTAKWLAEKLPDHVRGLKPEHVRRIDGSMRDADLMAAVEEFRLEQSKVRLLVASDVASEGVNLHDCSHRMYHFDIPWSLITFQQRNGRIDRYGQTEQPVITFMLSSVDSAKGDMNVLRHVIAREQAAHDNIGDPGQLMQVYSVDEETKIVSRAIEAARNGADAEAALEKEIAAAKKENAAAETAPAEAAEDDFWDLFTAETTEVDEAALGTGSAGGAVEKTEIPRLFPDEPKYLEAGLDYMRRTTGLDFGRLERHDRHEKIWLLRVPEALKNHCRHVLPPEVRRAAAADGTMEFTADPQEMQEAVKRTRRLAQAERDEEGEMRETWCPVSYLWRLNPVSAWVAENVNATFGSKDAPVVAAGGGDFPPALLMLATAPNRNGEPLLQRWMLARFPEGAEKPEILEGDPAELLRPYGLDSPDFANPSKPGTAIDAELLAKLEAMRAPAVEACRARLEADLAEFTAREGEADGRRLAELETRLDRFGNLEFSFMDDIRLTDSLKAARRRLVERRHEERVRARDNFRIWMETHRKPSPYRHAQIVAAIVCGKGA